jgi:hypothetical protein
VEDVTEIEWVEIPDEEGRIHLYHPETGEWAGPKGGWLPAAVQSEDDVHVIMRLHARTSSQIKAQKEMIRRIVEQEARILKGLTSRIERIEQMYADQLGNWAEENLPKDKDGKLKTKTMKLPFGDIVLRETKDKVSVANSEAAILWAEDFYPEAVTVKKSFLVSQLPEEIKNKMFEDEGFATIHGLSVERGRRTVALKTVAVD